MSLLLLLGVAVICIVRKRRSSARRKYAHCSTAGVPVSVNGSRTTGGQLAANLHTAAGRGVVGSQSGVSMSGAGEKVYNPLLYSNGVCDNGWGSCADDLRNVRGGLGSGGPHDMFICRGGEPWDEIQLRKLPEPPPINVADNAGTILHMFALRI